jgi:hypothetical protein
LPASITRPGGPTKRRKKTFSEKDPERADKLKAIEGKFITFDTKFTTSKDEVFGRKVKGKTGKPAANEELSEQRPGGGAAFVPFRFGQEEE